MKVELTKEFLDRVQLMVENQDAVGIEKELNLLHPADIADLMESLSIAEAKYIFENLNDEITAEVLIEFDEDYRIKFMKLMSTEEIVDQIDNLETDDAADILGELEDDEKDEIISQLEDKEHASEIIDLLNYEGDTAGGLMNKEYFQTKANWKIERCVIELRKQAENIEKVYSIYVVDDDGILLGILSLKSLLFAEPKTQIEDIYIRDKVHYVKVHEKAEVVAEIMEKYDLVSLPVVDRQHKLVGRITIDDVVDVIMEEAEKDFQMASGISENLEASSTVFKNTRSRLPWILIGLAGGVAASQIIRGYESQIDLNPALAFFIPLIVATAGNVGVQSSAIIVQGLASKDFQFQSLFKQVGKETLVGMMVGFICSVIIFGVNYTFNGDILLGTTISISLFVVVVIAAVLGALVPLLLDRIKIDPALATGPFITTANDIIGLSIYFMVAYFVYM
ncbi:magnesium transporter [Paracrocinitomix mangrovi]|uniref:magnesium transporter n=1 Tax=Paracrocinitomix mangrovi TaxID=2862509 RepID=UPI001C8DFC76|nr:magnesium transporter [Paracrocinitomix mangrovi]UKN03036.1 magnesium transporter [Paracrocinitomix mangrovi]